MIVTVAHSDRYKLLITVRETNQQDVIFDKDLKEILDFLELISPQLKRCRIELPQNLSTLGNEELGILLTNIVNHRQINQLLKVRGFFVNIGKSRIKCSSKTIESCKPIYSTITTETTSSLSKKPSQTFSGFVQLENGKELQRRIVDIANPELITYLQQLKYTDVTALGNGTSKAVFRAKNTRGDFVAVKIGKLEEEVKMNLEKNIMNSVGQKMSRALFGGFLEIYKVITDKANNFIVIQQQLASKTLRDIILQKRQKGTQFTRIQFKKIIQDLVESLYHMHVQNQVVHRDIKPQNIFYTQHRYTFGDYGEAEQKNVNILDKEIKIKMSQLKGTPMYMETKLLALCNRTQLDVQLTTTAKLTESHVILLKEKCYTYDPFKADVYSLGLVFFELMLHNAGYTMDDQIETLFYWQRGQKMFDELVKSFDLRSKDEKYILLEDKLLEVPSLLERMLDENQTTRISTFELSLLSTHKSTILSNLLTPFTDIFLPKVYSLPKNEFQVQYNYKFMVYVGEYVNEKRQGFGTMYRGAQSMINDITDVIHEQDNEYEDSSNQNQQNDINEISASAIQPKCVDGMAILYQGHWRADLPHKRGTFRLNDSDNKYIGGFVGGMFDGQGQVYCKQKLIYKAKWKNNYNDHILNRVQNFEFGVYTFRAVCRESISIYGFIERHQIPVKKFIIEIDNSMKSTIKTIFIEIIRVLSKTPIDKISQTRNYIHNYNQITLFAGQASIVFIFNASQQIMTWLLTQILQNFSLGSLANLDLSKSQFTSQPIDSLAHRLDCFSLIDIDLEGCYFVGAKSLNRLFSSSMVNNVLKINLGSTQAADSTLNILASSSYLTRLREMNLKLCRFITNQGFMTWVNSKNVKELELLDISDTFLADGVFKSFTMNLNSLKKLRRLRISNISFKREVIQALCKSKPMSGITEIFCGGEWIPYLDSLQKLRAIHFKGKQKISKKTLIDFFQSWKYNKLQIASPAQFTGNQIYQSCKESLKPFIDQQGHTKLIVSCSKNYIKVNIDLVTGELVRVDLQGKKDLDCLRERLTTGREAVVAIKQLVIRHGVVGDGGDFLNKLVKCDFSGIVVEKIRLVGYLQEQSFTTKVGLQMSKQKLLQLSEQIKELISVIKPKVIRVNEIFQRDSNIGALLRDKVTDIPYVKINGIFNSTQKVFSINFEPMPICKAFSDATLDQTLHALAASECLMRLTKLSLKGHTNVTDRGLAYIINSRFCSNIIDLDLSQTFISGNVFLLLKGSEHLQLRSLNLNNISNNLNFEDIEAYVFSYNSKLLKRFSLKNGNVNKLDLFFLLLNLESLEEIDMNFHGCIEPSVAYIDRLIQGAKYDKLRKIYLNLSKCKASLILKHILKSLGSPKLLKVKIDLSYFQATEDFPEKMISHEIFETNLSNIIDQEIILLNLNFNKTAIFENYFFAFLGQLRSVRHLRLSFSERFQNQHMSKLANSMRILLSSISSFELSIDRCTNLNKAETSNSLGYILENLTKVEALYLNFAYCRQMYNWKHILESLKKLTKVRLLNLNLERCKLVDQTDIICEWITEQLFNLQNQTQLKLLLNLTNCWRMQSNDRCFKNILKMINDSSKFSPKIRLYMKKIKLPLEFKTKLMELSKRPAYEIQFDQ